MKRIVMVLVVFLLATLVQKNAWGYDCYSDVDRTQSLPSSYCDSFPAQTWYLFRPQPGPNGMPIPGYYVFRAVDKPRVTAIIAEMYERCVLNVDPSAINNYWYPRMLDSYGGDYVLARIMTNIYISKYSSYGSSCISY